MRMAIRFIAGESAPDAAQAYAGQGILNNFGRMVLTRFIADPLDPTSEVRLDQSVEPPILHIRNALAATSFGNVDEQTGEFVPIKHKLPSVEPLVNGVYAGPGSELDLS